MKKGRFISLWSKIQLTWTGVRKILPVMLCATFLLTACGNADNSNSSTARSTGTTQSGSSSKSSSDTSKPPNIDACSLVTRDEADAIMGKLREAPKPATTVGKEKACSYGQNTDGANATLRLYGADQWDLQKGIDSEEKMTDVPGLGDEAYYTKKGTTTDLWVHKGGAVLNVNGSIGIDKAKGMAQKALSRL
jgi:hypothetical protein